MARANDMLTVIYQRGKKRMVVKSPLNGNRRVVVVLNSQFTNAPNTTQIASGAGRSSAAGNNASIDSTNTQQQQSVGAGGKAINRGMKGKQAAARCRNGQRRGCNDPNQAVIVVNDQVVKLRKRMSESSATQVAGGGGRDSAGGTNAAIESANTKQQHAVGGGSGSVAINKSSRSRQLARLKKKSAGKRNGVKAAGIRKARSIGKARAAKKLRRSK
ncbi:hypothetical protein ACFSO0_12070 [Brevibacillus sp. GCM10020057]|uniref:hypothetical protein n=1 Tax=Brevibacillus sp. GCM10020057 TaxID=3317327 RepID=UPI00363E74C6